MFNVSLQSTIHYIIIIVLNTCFIDTLLISTQIWMFKNISHFCFMLVGWLVFFLNLSVYFKGNGTFLKSAIKWRENQNNYTMNINCVRWMLNEVNVLRNGYGNERKLKCDWKLFGTFFFVVLLGVTKLDQICDFVL